MRLGLSAKIGASPPPRLLYHPKAAAYMDKVVANDSYGFSTAQRSAISDFFDALDANSLGSVIKKMFFVGFSVNAGLRDVMNPTSTESWAAAPVSGDINDGYATFDDENITTSHTLTSLGIAYNDCGAFFSGTNMTRTSSSRTSLSFVNAYSSPSSNFQLKQNTGENVFRAGYSANVLSTSEKQDGVFVGTRKVNAVAITRIKASRAVENVTATKSGGSSPAATISLWSGNVAGNVSSVGITSGLSAANAETLAGLIYDVCVGIGHTDLTSQDS